MMNIEIDKRKTFWEGRHRDKDVRALSGCSFSETVDSLQIRDLVEGKKVLEVGVGLGYVIREAYDICSMSALDISDRALEKVKPYCERTYNVSQIKELPTDYFDVIICTNLVQHIPTDLLILEFIELLRSLKPGGTFAVQFVSTEGSEDTGEKVKYNGHEVGCYCRTPEWMRRMIKSIGGDSVLLASAVCNIGPVKGSHIIHITK